MLLRQPARRLASRPFTTLSIILTLALGIGATTAIFTVVDQTVLRPAPFARAGRLVDVLDTDRKTRGGGNSLTPEKILGWQREHAVFEEMQAYAPRQFDLTGGAEPERVSGLLVSLDLLPMLAVQPRIGRGFGAGDGRPGGEPVALVSEGLWKRRFGGDPAAIGSQLTLNGRAYTIVGVLPSRFHLLSDTESLCLPLDLQAAVGGPDTAGLYGLGVLSPGLSAARAQALSDGIADRLQREAPLARTWDLLLEQKRVARVNAGTRTMLFLLLGAVGFVLVLVCANVATLLLSQAARRRREMAIRSALGASHAALLGEVLIESLLLAGAGGLFGVALAQWGVAAVLALAPARFAFMSTTTIQIDGRVLAAAAIVTALTGILCGLLPAWRGSAPNLESALRDGPGARQARHGRAPSILVAAELAIALVLLSGAALLGRTLLNLEAVDPGFDPKDVLTMHLDLPSDRYPTERERTAFFESVAERLRAAGLASDVAEAYGVPPDLGGFSFGAPQTGNGRAPGAPLIIPVNTVSPGYFRALRTPIVAGRTFETREPEDSAIVSRALAERLWPGSSAIGQRFRMSATDRWRHVVGVVGNVEARAAGEERTALQIYHPIADPPTGPSSSSGGGRRTYAFRVLLVRGPRLASRLADIKRQIWAVDPGQPVESVTTAEDLYAAAFGRQRFLLVLLSIFALVALALAVIGVFGVLSQLVVQRTREIGVRVALGATPGRVSALILGRGMGLAAAGTAAGLALTLALARMLGSLLFEVSPYDPTALGCVVVVLGLASLAACWVPVRAALRVHPAVALRAE